MSVKYIPVQWNPFKLRFNAVMLVAVLGYLAVYLAGGPALSGYPLAPEAAQHLGRAFGSCAFLLLTLVLSIGPLARLDARFLPLLYNRRHLGVTTFLVALAHAVTLLIWFFAFSPTPPLQAALSANTSYDLLIGFPIEGLGLFALLCLAVLAFTSHDFWLSFLSPPIWKALHLSIYPAYAAVVAHLSLGALQDEASPVFAIVAGCALATVCLLHATAAWVEGQRSRRTTGAPAEDPWVLVGEMMEIGEGTAKTVRLPNGDRVAVFRHEGSFSAISNACAHQNGPLGEGRIVQGCVTCPWHGFQYDVRTGCSPAPFTERVPTYALRAVGDRLFVNSSANPPGTPTEPVPATDKGVPVS